MKIYFAPIEGVTNCRYRRIHNKYYPGIDKYFVPFIKSSMGEMLNKELKDVDPDNNKINAKVIPQILSKNVNDTIKIINDLKALGYDEVNLNFGCPSATVVPKGKGGGILKDLKAMDEYLSGVFNNTDIKISIKIRLGIEDCCEFNNILPVLNKYNIYELIIHPRTVKDYYSGPLHLSILDDIDKKTNIDIIINGDIKTKDDINYLYKRFPFIKGVMIGRGLLSRPDFLCKIDDELRKPTLKEFYYELIKENRSVYGSNNSLFYEKELWAYLKDYFNVETNLIKKLNKCKKEKEIDEIVKEIFCVYEKK